MANQSLFIYWFFYYFMQRTREFERRFLWGTKNSDTWTQFLQSVSNLDRWYVNVSCMCVCVCVCVFVCVRVPVCACEFIFQEKRNGDALIHKLRHYVGNSNIPIEKNFSKHILFSAANVVLCLQVRSYFISYPTSVMISTTCFRIFLLLSWNTEENGKERRWI